jgi:hypothetical protein
MTLVARLAVICRDCAGETVVRVDHHAGLWTPAECRFCESSDLVALRDLTRGELEEIEAAVAERAS